MTDLLYQADSYLKEFDATVTDVTDDGVVLDQTAFYVSGGGQPGDTGTLTTEDDTTFRVNDVRRKSGKVVHVLAGDARPDVGATVHGTIDWDRRYELMRTHTAMHILCGVIWRDYEVKVTGGNMKPGQGRMDFEFDSMDKALAEEIEEKINVEVEAARPVRVDTIPREEANRNPDLIRTKVNLLPDFIKEVRTIEIKGLDLQADGGTHVANTEEVGRLRIADYMSKGRNNKRLVVELEESDG